MIFVGGVHCVGKTYFCKQINKMVGINSYTVSDLIYDTENTLYRDKRVENINKNQEILLERVSKIKDKEFLLDGHFCLLDKEESIIKIPYDIFKKLQPNKIVIITDEPKTIVTRRRDRDDVIVKKSKIVQFQNIEIEYAIDVANKLGIPYFIFDNGQDYFKVIDFILFGGKNGREI